MRTIWMGLISVFLFAVAGAAFAQTAPDEAEPEFAIPADTPPDHASPSVCIVILGRLQYEASEGRATVDAARLEAAAKTFRKKALALYDGDETALDQMVGSSVSFYDELTVPELTEAADLCLAAEGQTFTTDE